MKLLSKQIEKSIGISPPQEAYIHNINSGWDLEEAKEQFLKDNNQYITYMQNVKKDSFFILYFKFVKNIQH